MTKKPKTQNLHDELNFARFGVISMHSRVDQNITSWNTEFTVNARTFRIEAITPQGRPHGIDTDTLVALETLFVAHGCPEDNWVHTTPYAVRELMGLSNNGENYHRLRQSIRRLYFTSVIVGRKTALTGSQRVGWDQRGGSVLRRPALPRQ
ncbi:replication initiator protein A [Deinococcus sp. QL22]|uniref:replication initiator protein A n=1 Tax=Deinococcus sp. QL22 TaxID=2939437 RepID=UPI002017C469|nr:replication initiator protein A [Deinococcus sp. QL22]UQN09585.1 replication initiator protein A [Deinococcus sp. QL22]